MPGQVLQVWRDGRQWPVPICGCLLCQELWGLLGWSWCRIRAPDPARIHFRPRLTWCFLPSCLPFHPGHQWAAAPGSGATPEHLGLLTVQSPPPRWGSFKASFGGLGISMCLLSALGAFLPFQSPQVGCAPHPAGLLGFPMPPGMGHLCFIQNNKVFTKDTESLLGPRRT